VVLLVFAIAPATSARALPSQLSDRDFWRLVESFSEPGGFFRSDNLVSNEDTFQRVLPDLAATVPRGGAYLGVGPDQNFTYIAAIDPGIAFIVDIRRANLHLQLMYKALFELSDDRATFLSRLFSRPVPADLPRDASVDLLFGAFASAPPRRDLFERTRAGVIDRLCRVHGLPLSRQDTDGIAAVLETFFASGPEISYSNTARGWGAYPTFRDLQIAADDSGVQRGYLASAASYRRVRSLQLRNLIVPVVGDFAGSTAIRSIGGWVRAHGGVVGAFYTSNVEQYLFENGSWERFAASVATLPLRRSSLFIRSCFNDNCETDDVSRSAVLLDPIAALLEERQAGRITSYSDVLAFRSPVGR
jgi:hypothetical protein